MDHSHKNQIIRHELGHWTTAKSLGFSVGDIAIKVSANRNGGHNASAHIRPMHSFDTLHSLIAYLENRMAILHAGFYSQIHGIGEKSKEYYDDISDFYCSDDNSKISELSIILRGIIHSGNLTEDNEECHRRTIIERTGKISKEIVNENRSIIAMILPKISRIVNNPSEQYVIPYCELISWWNDFSHLKGKDIPMD